MGRDLQVLYCDNHLLVVVKPPGVLAQSDATGDLDLLTQAKDFLKQKFEKKGQVYLGLIHRLDRPASGVMVFARTSKAAARLTQQFKTHRTAKRYLAIVIGAPGEAASWEDFLIKDGRKNRVVTSNHPDGKKARLAWRALGHQRGCTLVDVNLFTGRPHQIRLQFASRGFPVLGDFRYSATKEFDGKNLALHCYSMGIEHPTKKLPLQWTAPPPNSWNTWFKQEREQLALI